MSTGAGPIRESLFGTLAVRAHFVLPNQVQEALALQEQYRLAGQAIPRLGEILAHKGFMTPEQVQAVLRGQIDTGGQRFGEIAVSLRFCGQPEIDAALAVQKQIRSCNGNQRLGEILVARGALRPHQVHSVLNAQGKAVIQCPSCRARLNVRGLQPGSSVNCPKCRTIFTPIPENPDPVLDAAAVNDSADQEVQAEHSLVMPAIDPAALSGAPLAAGLPVGPYKLVEKLGQDSAGVLYKGSDPRNGQAVVLRLLNPNIAGSKESVDRWIAAGQAASELEHPNLQRILSIGGEGSRVYVVMEWINGESLRRALKRQSRFPNIETVDLLLQAAEALNYGHAHGFLHGDLRPNQMLVGVDGILRVSGLGTPKNVALNLRQVAAQNSDEALPLYTPPEVLIDAENADERSDIYSLGAIGYHLLTGRPPHEGANALQVGWKIAESSVVPPDKLNANVPPYLNRLLLKCLEVEPDERYDSMAELIDDLRKVRQGLGGNAVELTDVAPAPTNADRFKALAERARKPRRRVRTYQARRPGVSTGKFPAVGAKRGNSGIAGAVGATGKFAAVGPRGAPGSTGKFPAAGAGRKSAVEAAVPAAAGPAPQNADAQARILEQSTNAPLVDDPELAETELERQLAAAQRKKAQKSAAPLDAGMPVSWIVAAAVVGVSMVAGILVVTMTSGPKLGALTPVVDVTKVKAPEPAPEKKPAVVANTEGSRAYRLIKEFLANSPDDVAEGVRRLDGFVLQYGEGNEEPDAPEAKRLLLELSSRGAKESLPALKNDVKAAVQKDQFEQAESKITLWGEQWRRGANTAAQVAELKAVLQKDEQEIAKTLMAEALSKRRARAFDQAEALYKRISASFRGALASEARGALLDLAAERDKALADSERETRERRELQERLDRERLAPERLKTLLNEIEGILAGFDLDRALKTADDAAEQFTNTPALGDFTLLKDDLQKLKTLRARMAAGIHEGKFSDPTVTVKGVQYTVSDATEKTLTLEAAQGAKLTVPWTDLGPGDLSDIARKASDERSGGEQLELGMLRYHLGLLREARLNLADAERMGAAVLRYKTRLEKKAEALAAAAPPPVPAAPAETKPAVPAVPAAQKNPTDDEVIAALKAKGVDVNRGLWSIAAGGVWSCKNDPNDTTLMSLKRAISPTFRRISVEVRGSGAAAGFSFGVGRRFTIKPTSAWQKLTIVRGTRIEFRVDDQPAKALDALDASVNASNLADSGSVFIRMEGEQGEFRNLVVEE